MSEVKSFCKSKIIFICVIIITCFYCSCKPRTDAKAQEKQDTTEQTKIKYQELQREKMLLKVKLQAKADSARRYCAKNKLNTDYCFFVDMSIHSGKNRFFVWDFDKDTTVYSGLCCHGYGLGGTESKPVFSNVPESYCSSLGKYKTGTRAYSNWGIHVHYKLHGLEATNSNAFRRMIVLHSYSYVPDWEIHPNHLPLGYSQGCPVIDDRLMATIDEMLKKAKTPLLLWIYN